MNKITRIIAGIIVMGIIAVGGYLGYIWFAGGSGEPSTDIDEATISLETTEATEVIDSETNEEAEISSETTLFKIVSESSEARFELDEELFGRAGTAIGTTDQVGGEILINFSNPQASQIGTIRINSRTITTDNSFRNRALRSEILLSSQDEFEFIDFEPTAVNDLPENIEIGGTYSFEIVGNLTVIGQTNEVTFATTVTIDSETQISGVATAIVLHADYGIMIPENRSLANVEDEVELTLTFVAERIEGE